MSVTFFEGLLWFFASIGFMAIMTGLVMSIWTYKIFRQVRKETRELEEAAKNNDVRQWQNIYKELEENQN